MSLADGSGRVMDGKQHCSESYALFEQDVDRL